MRTLAGITAVVMAAMTLWSCDEQQPAQTAQTQPAAPAAPPPCNCQPAPPPVVQAPPAPVQTAAVHHRRHYRHRYYASEEITPGSPGYVSESGAVGESEYGSASMSYVAPPPPPRGISFVDGYGRAHFWSQNTVAHFAHQADEKAFFERKRLDPWHKYGATCDWK